jgi:hypothetical protein
MRHNRGQAAADTCATTEGKPQQTHAPSSQTTADHSRPQPSQSGTRRGLSLSHTHTRTQPLCPPIIHGAAQPSRTHLHTRTHTRTQSLCPPPSPDHTRSSSTQPNTHAPAVDSHSTQRGAPSFDRAITAPRDVPPRSPRDVPPRCAEPVFDARTSAAPIVDACTSSIDMLSP